LRGRWRWRREGVLEPPRVVVEGYTVRGRAGAIGATTTTTTTVTATTATTATTTAMRVGRRARARRGASAGRRASARRRAENGTRRASARRRAENGTRRPIARWRRLSRRASLFPVRRRTGGRTGGRARRTRSAMRGRGTMRDRRRRGTTRRRGAARRARARRERARSGARFTESACDTGVDQRVERGFIALKILQSASMFFEKTCSFSFFLFSARVFKEYARVLIADDVLDDVTESGDLRSAREAIERFSLIEVPLEVGGGVSQVTSVAEISNEAAAEVEEVIEFGGESLQFAFTGFDGAVAKDSGSIGQVFFELFVLLGREMSVLFLARER